MKEPEEFSRLPTGCSICGGVLYPHVESTDTPPEIHFEQCDQGHTLVFNSRANLLLFVERWPDKEKIAEIVEALDKAPNTDPSRGTRKKQFEQIISPSRRGQRNRRTPKKGRGKDGDRPSKC